MSSNSISTEARLFGSVLDPWRSPLPAKIVCHYRNNTDTIQIVCISNIEGCYFERAVFPEQTLLFETVAEAVLEIRTGVMPTAIISDRILCLNLQTALVVGPSCPLKL